MDEHEILNLINDKKFVLASMKDLQKIIVSYLLSNLSYEFDIDNDIDNDNVMNYKKETKHLIENNLLLYQFLWIKYISIRLPEYNGVKELKQKYNTAIKIYKNINDMIDSNTNIKNINDNFKEYDVILRNLNHTLKIPTMNDYNKIIKKISKMTYFNFYIGYQKISLLYYFAIKYERKRDDSIINIMLLILEKISSKNNIIRNELIKNDLKSYSGDMFLNYVCNLPHPYDIKFAKLLIDNGANPNAVTIKTNRKVHNGINHINNRTPLIIAITKSKTDLAQLLINNGAHINPKNGTENYPLRYAMQNGVKMVKLLMDNGADIRNDDSKETLLIYPNICERAPLIYAAIENKYDIVKLLVEKGFDINRIDCRGDNALMYACMADVSIVKLLLDNGADVNHINENKDTPLMWACDRVNGNITKLLIDRGANINVRNASGFTPLIYACRKYINNVILLLDNGANINDRDASGKTAFYHAVSNNFFDIIKLLIKNHANINIADMDNITPLSVAIKNGNQQIIQYLKENGAY